MMARLILRWSERPGAKRMRRVRTLRTPVRTVRTRFAVRSQFAASR
nr:MAG TPA: hypothetical protein [Caudoviricetes sp.]